jgi:hypothetical protein
MTSYFEEFNHPWMDGRGVSSMRPSCRPTEWLLIKEILSLTYLET